ncbi:hypothetical protein WSM22_19440 [Cytophagales bacterium WSM2-2]|nr:hypothetical protein WSM22_19440 [Cytophagales bacterium WSM2-2]
MYHLKKLVFLVLGLLVLVPSFAQRGKKKQKEDAFATASVMEAERVFTEAEKNFILEDYTKALFYFQQALEYSPGNATVHYKMAEIYLKGNTENDLQRAIQSIESALKLEKKNKYFYLLASRIYATQHQFGKAAEALETMLKEISGTEENLYELAAIYLQDNRFDDALKAYNQAEAALGINELSSLQKQRIYLLKGKMNEAITEGDKLINTFPDEERYVLSQAEMLSQQGQPAQGITYVDKYIADHPDAGSSKVLRAGLYHDAGQEQKSREMVSQLFEDSEVALTSKVLMLGTYNATISQSRTKKQNDTPLENFVTGLFEKLKTNYPTDADVHLVGGDLFLTLEKKDLACVEYLKAIRLGANSFEAWQNLLYLETQTGAPDSVIVHAEQALELYPNQAMIYYFNGIAYTRKKNFREAARTLEQAKRLAGNNSGLQAEICGMLGDSYNALKDYEKSDRAYEDALAFNPNYEYVLNNYSYYLALRKTNLPRAENMSAQLVKSHPDNSSYLDTHAWVLYQEGKYRDARKTIEKVVSMKNANALHFEHYGDILYQLGEIDDAVAQWQKAKSLHGDNEALNRKITDRKIH